MASQIDPAAEAEKREDEWARKNLDHAITFAVEALKAALLLNGGAAIALLTLVGALSVKDSVKVKFSIEPVKIALTSFGSGVAAVTISFALAYISQLYFMNYIRTKSKRDARSANVVRALAILSLIASGILFLLGIQNALQGIQPNLQAEPMISRELEPVCHSWPGLPFSQCK